MSCYYSTISEFGLGAGNSAQNDPLTYCVVSGLESGFNHTIGSGSGLVGPNSSQCQLFMGQYCSNKWDGACEYLSNDQSKIYPNTVIGCNGPNGSCMGPGIGNAVTKGQILIRNAAAERYLVKMSDNCVRAYQPFDPTVAASPLVSKWVPSGNSCAGSGNCDASNVCIPVYDVNAKTIDSDPLMNKIFSNLSNIANLIDIFINIYNTRTRNRNLHELKNTRIGRFFSSPEFQSLVRR